MAADRFPGDPVDVGQPLQVQRVSTVCTVEAAMSSLAAISAGPSRYGRRRCTICPTTNHRPPTVGRAVLRPP